MVRLADLPPLHVAPASQAGPSLASSAPVKQAWPPPIGSEAAEDLMSEMRAAYAGAMASLPKTAAVPPPEIPRLPRGTVVKLPVALNARAADYARIWIVNLLLTVLTFGLYLPWARVRSQRYFLRRTLVAGHVLDYHAPPASHLPRYGLVLALVAGVVGACLGSPLAGLLAFSMALAVTPLAVHTSLTHRMAHTSWAGRRLSFKGQFTAVYGALLMPLMGVLVAAWSVLVSGLVMGLGAVVLGALLWWRGPAPGAWLPSMLALLSAAVLAAVVPYVQARLQNLVWSKTGNRSLRFRSRLSVQGYVLLQLRHALLLVLTLGFYWPWAVVASRRMRTEALTVWARVDTEVLKAHWTPFAQGQAGAAPKRRASA